MIDTVRRYKCDACGKTVCVNEGDNIPSWTEKTEIGDLCPTCARSWENYKQSFITKMKWDNREVENL